MSKLKMKEDFANFGRLLSAASGASEKKLEPIIYGAAMLALHSVVSYEGAAREKAEEMLQDIKDYIDLNTTVQEGDDDVRTN